MRRSHKGRQWAGPQLREAKLPPKCRVVREESRHGLRTCRPDPHTGAGHGRGEGHARGPSDSDARPSEWDPSRLGRRVLVLGEPSPAFFRAGPYARASARVKRRMEQVQIPPSGLHPARSLDDRLAVGHVTADVSLFRHHHGCKLGACPIPSGFARSHGILAHEEESQQRFSTRQAQGGLIPPITTNLLANPSRVPSFSAPQLPTAALHPPTVHGPARLRPRRRAAGHLSSPLFARPPLRGGRPGAPGAHLTRPPPRAWAPRRVSPALHVAHRRRSRRASRSPSRPAHPRPTPRGLGWTDAASGHLFDPGPTPTQPSRAVGRGVATTIIRRTSAPPGSPAAEDSGALIVGRMMPVSKPFLLHARGHRAQLRTPHPVLVQIFFLWDFKMVICH